MPTYSRSTSVDPLPGGDSVKQACIDLDTDLTGAFTGLNTLDTGKAPLASPALTGTPTAPTATAGTNTTQVATTAFVKALGDTKSPIAGPGSTQAFEVGALSADNGVFSGDVSVVGGFQSNCNNIQPIAADGEWTLQYTGPTTVQLRVRIAGVVKTVTFTVA